MNIITLIRKQAPTIAGILLATTGTICFPQLLNLKETILSFTNSIFAVLLWLLLLHTVRWSLRTIDLYDRRGWTIAAFFSCLFTAAMLFGVRLDTEGSVNFKDWKMWLSLPVFSSLFTVYVRILWNFLSKADHKKSDLEHTATMSERSRNFVTFLFLLVCWLPVLLAVYPGFFVYDAQDEWVQVASRTFNTHHPLVHVLMLGGIVCAVNKFTDSYNLGIACYIIFQMSIISCALTYFISYMRRRGLSRKLQIASLIYFALFPVVVMFTLCSAKDALFSIALLMLLLSLLDMGSESKTFFSSRRKMVFFVLCSTAMMLLRKNGIYAYTALLPILIFYQKKYAKKLSLLLLTALISYFVINSGLAALLHADNVERQEILTVPIQQLARTYKFNKEAFTDEDIETLHEILPEEALALYTPRLSDPVKVRFQNEAYTADPARYIRLWLRTGIKKPLSYINAWLVNTYGFWYPDTVVNVYEGHEVFTFTYKDSSYFGYEVEQPGTRHIQIPWLAEVYRKLSLEIWKEKLPLCSMLFSMGGMFWFFAFTFAYILYMKKYHLAVPCLLVLFVWLTVILGPTYLPRYVVIFWYGLPLFAAMLSEELPASVSDCTDDCTDENFLLHPQ